MAVTYAFSEFTDEKGTDWRVQIVDGTISSGHLNHAFVLGPDGFRLNYDFDNFDRSKPILGSRLQFTLFHPDDNDAAFNTLYNNLDSAAEGTYRVEVYRDPDGDNEVWWVGAVMAEQVIIPDEYPHAAVQITAVDGLGNLKGIDYNNDGAAYEGSETLTGHLHKALSKVHANNFWSSGDTFVKFFEDFIGDEYKTHISSGQNQQLNFAKVHHNTFYNKDDNGINQFFSTYTVLESLALTFNSCVFMAQGVYWFVPLGALQGHGSNHLDVAHFISGNGTVTYNTSTNMSFGVSFGNDNSYYEKLAGWERTSTPSFKEVFRSRQYQGDKPLILDGHYTEANIVAGTVLSDEDIAYSAGMQFLVYGMGWYEYDGDDSSSGQNRLGRFKFNVKIKVGDGGGTVRYLKREAGFPGSLLEWGYFYDGYDESSPDGGFYDEPLYNPSTWDASDSDYEIVSSLFDKKAGGGVYIPFQIITPPLAADATGIQISVTINGVDFEGGNDADVVDTDDARFDIYSFRAHLYDDDEPQQSDHAEIRARNPDDARYILNQGDTLLGDRITDNDLGQIVVYDGSNYVSPSEWTSIFNTTSNLSINRLGVMERLAGNLNAIRAERGSIYRTGALFIHPYTILTNTGDSNNFYQITGLKFIAASCEYDIECMYISRAVVGVDGDPITVVQDNIKGPAITDGIPGITGFGEDSEPKGPGNGIIPAEAPSKLTNITIDSYGITALKISDGASSTWNLTPPTSAASAGETELMVLRDNGTIVKLANGTAGQVLTVNAGATAAYFQDAAGGESGWFNSTTLMKVMPTEFMANDDGGAAVIEDDVTDSIGVKCSTTSTEIFVTKAIPTGYKATHVQVYASSTESATAVRVRNFDHTDGDLTNETTGDLNTLLDITDITSSATQNIMIKLTPGREIVYGADITIAAV